jgi:hypothetical protein
MVLTTLINILSWYYVIAFCGIYVTSSIGWIFGSFSGIILDWVALSTAIPLFRAFIRVIIRKYKFLNFLISLEFAVWVLKNICG